MNEEQILKIYKDPKHGLSGVRQMKKTLKEMGINIKEDELIKILQKEEAYSLNKPIKKKFETRKTEAREVMQQLQADLVQMPTKKELAALGEEGAIPELNDGVRFLLTAIDIFSKYAWVVPLKNKTGDEVSKALEPIIKKSLPELLQVDHGSEFYNTNVKNMLKKYGVKMFSVDSGNKAAIVERFNRTLKMKMARLFDATNKFRYIDHLDDLVHNYNNSYHRTIGMTPVEALNPKNYVELFKNFNDSAASMNKPRFKVGDLVRIPKGKNVFSKEGVGNWSIEIFKVKKVNKTQPVTYELEDLKGEGFDSAFYNEELQRVHPSVMDQAFRINPNKPIKYRNKNGKKEAYVHYLGWHDKFAEWIPAENIGDLK